MIFKSLRHPRIKIMITLLLLFAATYFFIDHAWYSGHQFLFSNDTRLPIDMKAQNNTFFYVWTSNTAPGNFDPLKLTSIFPIGIVSGLFYLFSIPLNPSIYQKIMLTTLLLFSGISFYYLVNTLAPTTNKLCKIIGSIIYTFNFYSLYLWISLTPILFRYCFFPLVLGLYIKFLNTKNLKILPSSIALSIIYTLTITPAYGTIPLIILDFLFLFLFLFVYLIFHHSDGKAIKKSLVLSLTSLFFWVLFNLFYILPLAYGFTYTLKNSINSSVAIFRDSHSLYLLNSSRVVDSIRLLGFWAFSGKSNGIPYYHWFGPYSKNPFLALSFIIPLISFIALFSKKYRQTVLFFGLTIILFIFFVKGEYEPLGWLNSMLFSHFSLEAMFRSGYQRFVGYLALSFSVLFTIGLSTILNIRYKIKHRPETLHEVL